LTSSHIQVFVERAIPNFQPKAIESVVQSAVSHKTLSLTEAEKRVCEIVRAHEDVSVQDFIDVSLVDPVSLKKIVSFFLFWSKFFFLVSLVFFIICISSREYLQSPSGVTTFAALTSQLLLR
jgi:hypothetical protein